MFYLLWAFGIAFTILLTAIIVMSIEKTGKFDE